MKQLALISFVALGVACCTHKDVPVTTETPSTAIEGSVAATGPRAIIYRTRVDVGDAVPITLSADGKEVVSYPHPSDLRKDNGYPIPTPIGEGYLLDNRGIGPNTAFLKWSYAEYASFDKSPTLEELQAAIAFRAPFAEMYDCGVRSRYPDPVKELGEIVHSGTLHSRCKKLR